jgi:hypothetical protein
MDDVDYRIVSADSHVFEPHDVWQFLIEPRFRDRAPRLVCDDDTDRPVCDQAELPPVGLPGVPGVTTTSDVVRARALMWGNDFPHHVSTWPRFKEVLAEYFDAEPDEVRRQVVCDNVRQLYRF